MSIIQADFDWISLLVVVGAGIIGLIKSGTKKVPDGPVNLPRDFMPEEQEEETVEWFSDTAFSDKTTTKVNGEETIVQGDYYKQPQERTEEELSSLYSNSNPEEIELENEELKHFNLRKAIISSEILRRPEY